MVHQLRSAIAHVIKRIRIEFKYLFGFFYPLFRIILFLSKKNNNIFVQFEATVAKYHNKVFLTFPNGEKHTYGTFLKRSNCFTQWCIANNIKKGDCVAVMMENSIDYASLIFGIGRTGAIISLIPTYLEGTELADAINICQPKVMIVQNTFIDAFSEAEKDLLFSPIRWIYGDHERIQWPKLKQAMAIYSDEPINLSQLPIIHFRDNFLYVFTSGGSSPPKATRINHLRAIILIVGYSNILGIKSSDNLYIGMHLYHIRTFILLYITFIAGASLTIYPRNDFNSFWKTIVDHEITILSYLGQVLQIVMHTPTLPHEDNHSLRICSGIAMPPVTWKDFKIRYKTPSIHEVYMSTEGNAFMVNYDEKPGSVGRIPFWLSSIFNYKLMKVDYQTGELLRTKKGFCIPCKPNEIGELVSVVSNSILKPSQAFSGYLDPELEKRALIQNVFKKDDCWYRSGDLMTRDKKGFFWFKGKLQEAILHQGELVPSSDILECANNFPGIKTAVVYGINAPNYEDKVCMIAIIGEFFIADLYDYFCEHLDRKHIPTFVRIITEDMITPTYRWNLRHLTQTGIDPLKVADPLYVLDPEINAYIPVNLNIYNDIKSMNLKI